MSETCLAEKHCIPCKGGVPRLTPAETKALKSQVPEWSVVKNHHLMREFGFKDFVSGLDFINSVGALAEKEGHHPDIYLSWGKVRVEIWTHKVDGLTESDFILAAKISNLV